MYYIVCYLVTSWNGTLLLNVGYPGAFVGTIFCSDARESNEAFFTLLVFYYACLLSDDGPISLYMRGLKGKTVAPGSSAVRCLY